MYKFSKWNSKKFLLMGSCVALLVEQLFPKPEICGSNPVIGKCYLLSSVFKKTTIRKKSSGILLPKAESVVLIQSSAVLNAIEKKVILSRASEGRSSLIAFILFFRF